MTVHGDDFTSTGREEDLRWLEREFSKVFEVIFRCWFHELPRGFRSRRGHRRSCPSLLLDPIAPRRSDRWRPRPYDLMRPSNRLSWCGLGSLLRWQLFRPNAADPFIRHEGYFSGSLSRIAFGRRDLDFALFSCLYQVASAAF